MYDHNLPCLFMQDDFFHETCPEAKTAECQDVEVQLGAFLTMSKLKSACSGSQSYSADHARQQDNNTTATDAYLVASGPSEPMQVFDGQYSTSYQNSVSDFLYEQPHFSGPNASLNVFPTSVCHSVTYRVKTHQLQLDYSSLQQFMQLKAGIPVPEFGSVVPMVPDQLQVLDSFFPLQHHSLHQKETQHGSQQLVQNMPTFGCCRTPPPDSAHQDRHLGGLPLPRSRTDPQVKPRLRRQQCQRSEEGKRVACVSCRRQKKKCTPLPGNVDKRCR
jgi:hypothetical protein